MKVGNVAIVGAGVAGLTLADRWAARGQESTVVECESSPGGLARSIELDGNPYDFGPHRFYSSDREVEAFILGVLEENVEWIERKTSIFFKGKFHTWPINHRALISLPIRDILQTAGDLVLRRKTADKNFEDFIIGRYGQTLYRIFFRPMTEKFFRLPCMMIHPEWGTVSVDRAIIDKNPDIDSLAYLARRLLRPERPLRFIYPRQGGIQAFSEALAKRATSSGICHLNLNTEVTGLKRRHDRIEALELSTGEILPVDTIVWTAPLSRLWELLTDRRSPLSFVSTIFYYFIIDPPPSRPQQWIYLPSPELRSTRITLQGNFYPKSNHRPPGVCCEVTASDGEHILTKPEHYRDVVLDDLRRVRIVSRDSQIVSSRIVVVPNTYPMYTVDYPSLLSGQLDELTKYTNLFPLGRSAMFVYNNMNNSVKVSIEFARWIESRGDTPLADEKKNWILHARDQY